MAERQPNNEPSQERRDAEPESDRGWRTITEEIGESKSWHSYKAVKREIGPVEGTEVHHIVEQAQAKPERSGFTAGQINSSDNMTRLPEHVHREISAEYSRKGLNPAPLRDMLDGLPWDEQYEIGCAMIDEKMRSHDDRDS